MRDWDLRLAAFVEYVVRPLSEDWRAILEQVKTLGVPLTPRLITHTVVALGLWHLLGELLRAACYITITWLICRTVQSVL